VSEPSGIGQPTRSTEPSILIGSVMCSNPCNYMDYGMETIKRQTMAMYSCMAAGQSP